MRRKLAAVIQRRRPAIYNVSYMYKSGEGCMSITNMEGGDLEFKSAKEIIKNTNNIHEDIVITNVIKVYK